jgi:glycosyltransferase involved in cell wall biosynthesis
MRKILWLVSWYPNATDPFTGDFIKRQAEAVSAFQSLKIIFVGKKTENPIDDQTNLTALDSDNKTLQEFILYDSTIENGIPGSKIVSLYRYFKKHLGIIRLLKKSGELPDLIHVHVAMKAGLVALYLKWKYKIPYVLTEHWTGYYPEAKYSLFKKSYFFRYCTKQILKKADRFLPVSNSLGNLVNRYWAHIPFQIIPNCVNTSLFFPSTGGFTHGFRFIHISSLTYPKNPEGIIQAFTKLLKHDVQADLVLVGPLSHSLTEFISASGLPPERIHCTGELSYERVGIELRKSSALVMFSHYENMPCVILEALCTGVPVIAADVGGIPEVINKENGILVQAGDEDALADAMTEMIRNCQQYDKSKISTEAAALFSYQTIGEQIMHVYDSVLDKNNHL